MTIHLLTFVMSFSIVFCTKNRAVVVAVVVVVVVDAVAGISFESVAKNNFYKLFTLLTYI